MRKLLVIFILSLCLFTIIAAEPKDTAAPVQEELKTLAGELADTTLDSLTISDLQDVFSRLALANRKEMFIRTSGMASMIMPGLGQFMNHDIVGGTLFMLTNLTIAAGTLIGGYFLLPANVQITNLDYLNAPIATIKNTWQQNNILAYLPTGGVILGGAALSMLVRHFAGSHAVALAQKNIANNKITFEPGFGISGKGFGMMMKMRVPKRK